MAEHKIVTHGNSGVRNAITHARHLQATVKDCFYYLLPFGAGWFGKVIIQEMPPMWYDICIAVPPLGKGAEFYMHGNDSATHVDIGEYLKWIRYLIDNGGINW